MKKLAFIGATVIIISVILIEILWPEIAGGWTMGLLIVAVILGYFGIRETTRR